MSLAKALRNACRCTEMSGSWRRWRRLQRNLSGTPTLRSMAAHARSAVRLKLLLAPPTSAWRGRLSHSFLQIPSALLAMAWVRAKPLCVMLS